MSGRPDVPGRDASPQGPMIEPRPDRLPAQPPTVAAPRAVRRPAPAFRRAEDRIAHQEKVLLARALDVLASDGAAEERLAGLLRLLARTVGARRAAVVADGVERRAAVAVDAGRGSGRRPRHWPPGSTPHAPRSRARRAAAGPRADLAYRRRRRAVDDRTPRTAGRPDAEPAEAPAARRGRPTDRAATTPMLPIPTRRRGRARLRVRPAGRRGAARRAPAADAGPPRRRSPSPCHERSSPTERELADAPRARRRADDVRLDGRPRAADAADRPRAATSS